MIYLRSHSWKVGEMDYTQQSPNFEPPATAPDPWHLAKDGAGKEGALCQALWVWKSSPLNLFYWGSDGLQTWMSKPSSVLVQALADWQELVACVSSRLFITDITLIAWNQLQWECSHHGNQPVLQIRDCFTPLIRLELAFRIKCFVRG